MIKTDRTTLLPIGLSDFGFLKRLYNNYELMRYITERSLDEHEIRQELESHTEAFDRLGFGLYKVIAHNTSTVIGRAGYITRDITGEVETEIAYMFFRQFWRKGFATEISKVLLEYGFGSLKLDHIIAIIHPDNIASKHVAEKIGMKYEKTLSFKEKTRLIYGIKP